MDASSYFRGKRITVMGIDPGGRGVQDALFLADCGAEVTVTDLKCEEQLTESVVRLRPRKNISFSLGGHKSEDFIDKDLIVRAASVPLGSQYLEEARKQNIEIKTDETLFLSYAPHITTIGVTGTRGKSTVTEMIHAILQSAGKRSFLGGNVRGKATLPLLAEINEGDTVVMELDSWKLQGFGEAKISPNIGVFTTFYQDHLNYYGSTSLTTSGAMDAYLADKANVFLYQKPEDTLVLGKQCAPILIEKYGDKIESKVIIADELKIPDTWTLRIPGIHNRYNAALALAAARALGITDETSRKALEAFKGVPGRLELIAEKDGVKIYNDTTSTTPEATNVAITALSDVGRGTSYMILIMGGTDKELDMNALVQKLPEMKRVILLAGSGTDRIVSSLHMALGSKVSGPYDSLADAVTEAFAHAEKGDTILFSPAFTSFGMFKNEYDRGDQFVEEIMKYDRK